MPLPSTTKMSVFPGNPSSGWGGGARVALLVSGLLLAHAAEATIYSCVDAQGHRHTSDRPIPECLDRGQQMLNRDGSLRQAVPPRMSPEERAVQDERDRQKSVADAAQKDAVRRDRNLMMRFPNEAAHTKAREAALDDVRRAIAISEKRISELQAERKSLNEEAEFFKDKNLPIKLRIRRESNEAQQQAQRDAIDNQKAEMVRVNSLYDAELARLKKLWAGAAPGFTVLPSAGPSASPATDLSRPASSSAGR